MKKGKTASEIAEELEEDEATVEEIYQIAKTEVPQFDEKIIMEKLTQKP